MAMTHTPTEINAALCDGAALAISISGGKDSQALLSAVLRVRRAHGWTGPVFAIHSDLGRAEWTETPAFVKYLAEAYGVDLVVVRREKGDLVDRMRDRMTKLEGTGKPFWPSSSARYCTSDLKRDPIDKYLRRFDKVVCAMGLRAEESSARAKKLPCQFRTKIHNSVRDAFDWHPLLRWTQDDVWAELGTSQADLDVRREQMRDGLETLALAGWPAHPAYVHGNERLSCALCILACRSDLINGARRHPDLYAELCAMERESGFTFRQDLSLVDLLSNQEKAP